MNGDGINNFNDWVNSSLSNGYCFKSDLRLKPGPNNCFFWKPLVKPTNGEEYVRSRVYDYVNGKFVPTDKVLDICRTLFKNNLAFKLH